ALNIFSRPNLGPGWCPSSGFVTVCDVDWSYAKLTRFGHRGRRRPSPGERVPPYLQGERMPRRTPEQNARRRAEYALNRDEINAQRRALRDSEKDSADQRARYWRDPEKARAQRRAAYARNHEKERVNRQARYT